MENLEDRVKKLEDTVDILKHTLKDLLTKTNPDLNITQQDKNTNSDLIPKDKVLIKSLLERSKDEFHIKFLSNILGNKYDTLTQKQYNVLVNIQNSI